MNNDHDHNHFLMWAMLLLLLFNSSLMDCSGERTKQENRIRNLEYKIQQLEGRR